MTTHFIEAEIDLQQTSLTVTQAVEEALEEEGKPLRWAITKVDQDKQTAQVEAIVTK